MKAKALARTLAALIALGAPSCGAGGEGEDEDDAGGDGDTDADSDGDTDDGALHVEVLEPQDGAVVPINQLVHLRFVTSSQVEGHVDLDTVTVLVDGEPVNARPYYEDADGNRELRFMPFPLWAPGEAHEVTVLAGAALAADLAVALEEDFTFGFEVDDAPFEEDCVLGVTPDLDADEIAAMHAGGGDVFLEADVVEDWQAEDTPLRDISIPVCPDDPEVAAFAQKLIDSMPSLGAVGLAAPQVKVGRRVFAADVNGEPRAFVNPEIVDYSTDDLYYGFDEGCLSIDGVSCLVGRPAWIEVEFDTPTGERVTGFELEDFDAKVFLHEYDHLNGVLMVDREERRGQ